MLPSLPLLICSQMTERLHVWAPVLGSSGVRRSAAFWCDCMHLQRLLTSSGVSGGRPGRLLWSSTGWLTVVLINCVAFRPLVENWYYEGMVRWKIQKCSAVCGTCSVLKSVFLVCIWTKVGDCFLIVFVLHSKNYCVVQVCFLLPLLLPVLFRYVAAEEMQTLFLASQI